MNTGKILDRPLKSAPLQCFANRDRLWNQVDVLTLPGRAGSAYTIGFASSDLCVQTAQRLRYEVFNLELDEGFTRSSIDGLDWDEYDAQMTHLVLMHTDELRVVGTYRLQTAMNGLMNGGIYSSREFSLSRLSDYLPDAVECGRACLAADHRSLDAILQLWSGIGRFMQLSRCVYLFGCCSIKGTNPDDGWGAMKTLQSKGWMHPTLCLPAKREFACGETRMVGRLGAIEARALPKLFRTYLRLGASVVSEPAIDREFGTVDFLVLIDGRRVNLSSLDIRQAA